MSITATLVGPERAELQSPGEAGVLVVDLDGATGEWGVAGFRTHDGDWLPADGSELSLEAHEALEAIS
jgi:hypothetical protein